MRTTALRKNDTMRVWASQWGSMLDLCSSAMRVLPPSGWSYMVAATT